LHHVNSKNNAHKNGSAEATKKITWSIIDVKSCPDQHKAFEANHNSRRKYWSQFICQY